MRDPRHDRALATVLCAAVCLLAFAPGAPAQQKVSADASSDIERGARFYTQGNMKEAVKAYRSAVKLRRDDPAAWLALGQALVGHGDLKEARKALDTSIRLRPDYAPAHASLAYLLMLTGRGRDADAAAERALQLDPASADAHYVAGLLRLNEQSWLKAAEHADRIIKLDPRAAVAYQLKAEALLGLYQRAGSILSEERRGAYDYDEKTVAAARESQPRLLREAADNIEAFLRLRPNYPDADFLRSQVEALRAYERGARPDDADGRIYSGSDLTATGATAKVTRAVITFKPEPQYTEEARRAGVSGVVRLRVVLGFDGRVRHVLVVKGLSHGLTGQAVRAARGLRFTPATVNGLPVSQYVVLEYSFNVW
ncbi:MAG TPA: TonB family protein [Pyrinomonadaceae bacterium]|nr:TonB family protein [Pyrinomonadaceae bacterium]